jgi:hypothetical protein
MKRHLTCKACNSHGYKVSKSGRKFILRDCLKCRGRGFVIVEIVDKRKNSANEGMNLVPGEA